MRAPKHAITHEIERQQHTVLARPCGGNSGSHSESISKCIPGSGRPRCWLGLKQFGKLSGKPFGKRPPSLLGMREALREVIRKALREAFREATALVVGHILLFEIVCVFV